MTNEYLPWTAHQRAIAISFHLWCFCFGLSQIWSLYWIFSLYLFGISSQIIHLALQFLLWNWCVYTCSVGPFKTNLERWAVAEVQLGTVEWGDIMVITLKSWQFYTNPLRHQLTIFSELTMPWAFMGMSISIWILSTYKHKHLMILVPNYALVHLHRICWVTCVGIPGFRHCNTVLKPPGANLQRLSAQVRGNISYYNTPAS